MKLIGITGKSGSGKTTLSRMLKEKDKDLKVIHIDEISNMNELKSRLPDKLIDEDLNTNELGEDFLMLSKPIRNIKDTFLKNNIINKMYRKTLKIFKEIDLKGRINDAKRENRKVVIIEGTIIATYSIYKNMDYIIQIDAPFIQREERAIKRKDRLLEKNSMVMRDLRFREAMKKGKRKGKNIDEKIENTGTLEDLQKIADDIYINIILDKDNKKGKTMQEKYGGYKSPKIDFNDNIKTNNRLKENNIADDKIK